MEFSPNNNVVKLCIQGMEMEEKERAEEAIKLFFQAWNEATNDFEKFTVAHYIARHQKNVPNKLRWLETGLQLGLKIDDDAVKGAFPYLYSNIAKCYGELGDQDNAKKYQKLAKKLKDRPSQGALLSWNKSRFASWRFADSRGQI